MKTKPGKRLAYGFFSVMILLVGGMESRTMAQNNSEAGTRLVCTLAGPELQARRTGIISELRKSALETQELKNGWSFRYADENVDKIVEFVKVERKCCSFLEFSITFESGMGPVWFSVTGPEGAKAIIAAELKPETGASR